MSILYGKVRVYTYPGQDITITDGKGNTKTVQTTGQEFTDIALPGMEEYTIANALVSKTVTLNIGDFAEVTLIPRYYDELKSGVTLTEAQWLAFLNEGGIKYIIDNGETSEFLGKKVSLTNSAESTYTTWSIGDFNHDSTNDTCDLILDNTIYQTIFGSSQTYSSSDARTWLTGTYYNGFSTDVKNKLQTMAVASNGSTLNDKVKLLSTDEVGITSAHTRYRYSVREGTRYPIFPAGGTGYYETNSDRIRTGVDTVWWLRSRVTDDSTWVWHVDSDGAIGFNTYSNSRGLIPAIRFA